VYLRDNGGAFANGRCDPLGRAGPDVADGEYARPAGFEGERSAVDRAVSVGELAACDHETFPVDFDTLVQPAGIRVGADEQEDVA
jgi:hypothetical protein